MWFYNLAGASELMVPQQICSGTSLKNETHITEELGNLFCIQNGHPVSLVLNNSWSSGKAGRNITTTSLVYITAVC